MSLDIAPEDLGYYAVVGAANGLYSQGLTVGEFAPDYWKNIPEKWFDNGYDGGTVPTFDMFARAVLEDLPVPLSPEATLNWTAAGICSEKSSDLNGVPVEIPTFRN